MGVNVPPPRSAELQFMFPNGKLCVDKITDPTGAPRDVLDADVGVVMEGHVELPCWLSGKGVVRLVADQIGGELDKVIATDTFQITGGPQPAPKKYAWRIELNPIPVPEDCMYRMGLIFVFQTPAGDHTEVAGFYDLGVFLIV